MWALGWLVALATLSPCRGLEVPGVTFAGRAPVTGLLETQPLAKVSSSVMIVAGEAAGAVEAEDGNDDMQMLDLDALNAKIDVVLALESAQASFKCPAARQKFPTAPGKCSFLNKGAQIRVPDAEDNAGWFMKNMWNRAGRVEPSKEMLENRVYRVGNTSLMFSLSDEAGNRRSCETLVEVEDQEKPRFAFHDLTGSLCGNTLVAHNDPGVCGAVMSWEVPTVEDNCPGAFAVTPEETHTGHFFPVSPDQKVIEYAGVDRAGNRAVCPIRFKVLDTEAPKISCRGASLQLPAAPANASAPCADYVRHEVSCDVSDNCAGVQYSCDKHEFRVGTTSVTCRAIDARGQVAEATVEVIVRDVTPPVVKSCPSNMTVRPADGEAEAVVTWTPPTADDNACAPVRCVEARGFQPGQAFGPGTHTVSYTCRDVNQLAASCDFQITVPGAPVTFTSCPVSVRVKANPFTRVGVVDYRVEAVDKTGARLAVVPEAFGLESGAGFPIGSTVLAFRASSPSGGSSRCVFPVVVSPPDKPQVWSPFSDRGATERIPTGETAGVDPYEQCGGLIIAKDPAGAANYTPIVASRNFSGCAYSESRCIGTPAFRYCSAPPTPAPTTAEPTTAKPTTAKPTTAVVPSASGGTTPGRPAQPTAEPTTSATEPKTQEPTAVSPSAESATGRPTLATFEPTESTPPSLAPTPPPTENAGNRQSDDDPVVTSEWVLTRKDYKDATVTDALAAKQLFREMLIDQVSRLSTASSLLVKVNSSVKTRAEMRQGVSLLELDSSSSSSSTDSSTKAAVIVSAAFPELTPKDQFCEHLCGGTGLFPSGSHLFLVFNAPLRAVRAPAWCNQIPACLALPNERDVVTSWVSAGEEDGATSSGGTTSSAAGGFNTDLTQVLMGVGVFGVLFIIGVACCCCWRKKKAPRGVVEDDDHHGIPEDPYHEWERSPASPKLWSGIHNEDSPAGPNGAGPMLWSGIQSGKYDSSADGVRRESQPRADQDGRAAGPRRSPSARASSDRMDLEGRIAMLDSAFTLELNQDDDEEEEDVPTVTGALVVEGDSDGKSGQRQALLRGTVVAEYDDDDTDSDSESSSSAGMLPAAPAPHPGRRTGRHTRQETPLAPVLPELATGVQSGVPRSISAAVVGTVEVSESDSDSAPDAPSIM